MVGTLLVPDGGERVPGVLVVHGFRGNRHEHHITAVADAIAWAGFVTLRVDLTNNLGESDGTFRDCTVSSEVSDALDALSYLSERCSSVGIVGHSLGGLVAVLAGTEARAIVTLSAVYDMAPRLRDMLGDRFPDWAVQGEIEMDPPGCGVILGYQFYEDLIRQDVSGALAGLTAPIRIVHGEDDKGVPVQDARRFYEGAASEQKDLALLPGADHGYSRDSDLMKVCLYTADWFRRWL